MDSGKLTSIHICTIIDENMTPEHRMMRFIRYVAKRRAKGKDEKNWLSYAQDLLLQGDSRQWLKVIG